MSARWRGEPRNKVVRTSLEGTSMANPRTIDLDTLLDEDGNEVLNGHDINSVGPSDSSDTGADSLGAEAGDSTSDRNGTGERVSLESDVDPDADISADRIVEAEDAGLGGGLDQAEEAQLGITDEEIDEAVR
jgi:hypothetical protein